MSVAKTSIFNIVVVPMLPTNQDRRRQVHQNLRLLHLRMTRTFNRTENL